MDVNARDTNSWTLLHYAANYGRNEVTELLIAKGADVNAKNKLFGFVRGVAPN
jgi:ankyrin repeat protein